MNSIRQRLVSLRHRARDVQNSLRRWSIYVEDSSLEGREAVLARWTPAEREEFERDVAQMSQRLKPVAVHIETLGTWYKFVLEAIEARLNQAQALLDQGRNHECINVLADIEQRLITPNWDTLAFATRSFAQRVAPTSAHYLTALDAIIRSLYLPTIKNAHQRGLLVKEALSRTPLAMVAGFDAEGGVPWRQHVLASAAQGRFIPISLIAVRQQFLSNPWNLVGTAFDVGLQIYSDMDMAWETAHKLTQEAPLNGVSPETTPIWARWHETLFGDVFGVLKLGPAYVSGMIEMLSIDHAGLFGSPGTDAVPPAYIRWHVMLQTLHLLSYADEARERFNHIHVLCGDPNQLAQQFGPIWMQLINEARAVAGLIAFSPLQKLGGARVIDVVPPLLTNELQTAVKIKDLLLGGDQSCTEDAEYQWAESARDTAPYLALAGLRLAFDAAPKLDTAASLTTRFWCLMQYLTREASSIREQEDREFAPGQETLKTIAQHAAPIAVA
ncbi:MAG: hypothetical protein V3T70_05165 [Phycisphaerae bacterium]